MLITLKTDLRPPSAPVLGSPTTLSTTSISVPLQTAASDPSGVTSYTLEYATSLNGTYVAFTSAAVFPQIVTDLSPSTQYYFRARAVDSYGNTGPYSGIVSATTEAVPPISGLSWPAHVPGYVSLLPEVGGYGMNTVAGSGRHLATPATTIILVNSLASGNTGSAATGLGPNVFQGTFEYAWRHAASPKVIIPIISGWVTIQDSVPCQTGTPPRPGYVTYYGQFAPNPGLWLRGANVASNGASNMAVWHLRSYMGDDVAGLGAGNRDCFSSGYGAGTTQQIVLINCELAWSVDELCDFNRSHSQVTCINCAFIEPLHVSTVVHPEDGPGVDHGFGPIIGGDTGQVQTTTVSCFRNLWAHTTGRNPLVSSRTYVHANNLHYNHGRPTGGSGNGVQIIGAGATEANFANILGNGFIRGPNNNTSLVAVTVASSMPAGSAGYSFANCQFGWTNPTSQNGFFTSAPSGYIASTVQADAYPGSWGSGLSAVLQWASNPLAPTLAEWHEFVTLMERTVGAQPRWRTSQYGRLDRVFDQIRDRLNGVSQTDQFVDTVTEAGGWFTVPSVTINPLNPGSHWHAPLPTGADRDTPYTSGTFSDGKSRVGYTRLEEWAYEQHLYVTSFDLVAPSVPGSVTATALSQTAIRIAWAASTDTGGSGLSGYRVYRATLSTGSYTQISGDLSSSTLSFDDTTLSAGSTRYYRVTAFDAAGNESNTSTTASATTHTLTIARLPFSDSFETGTTGAWDVTAGSIPVTTAEAYIGTRSSMITAPGGGTPNDNYLEYNFGDHPSVGGTPTGMNDLWIRVAHKWSSNWNDNGYASVQKVFLLNIHNPSSGQRRYQMTFNIWTPNNMYFCEFLRITEAGAFNGTTRANLDVGVTRVLGQWIEFVFHVRMNTPGASDGILQIWSKAQGATSYTQRIDLSNVNFRESTNFSPNRLIQSNYQPDGTPSGTRYWDAWLLQQTPIDVSASSTESFGSYTSMDLANQRIYRIDANANDTPRWQSEGGTVTVVSSGNVDGGPYYRMRPPVIGSGGTGQGNVGLGQLIVRNRGADIRKLNIRWEQRHGSAWITEMSSMNKWMIVQSGPSPSSDTVNERPMLYLSDMDTQAGDAPSILQRNDLMAVGVASNTNKNFEQLQSGFAGYNWPRGNESFYFGSSNTTIGGKRVVDATQWYTCEMEMFSQNQSLWPSSPAAPSGAANGLIRLVIWNRANEILTDLYIPWNWAGSWTVGDDYFIAIDVLGGYQNALPSPSANNYIDFANVTLAANRNGLIGPRSGFLTG